mgnify:CR=1 FL=1
MWGSYEKGTRAAAIQGIRDTYYWDKKQHKRVMEESKNTCGIKVLYQTDFKELLQQGNIPQRAVLICTPHVLDNEWEATSELWQYYSFDSRHVVSVGEPDLLVLDEPINGLDPQGIAEIRDTIQRLQKEKNMTICISSHILEELSKIATDYGIIHNGSLLQEITREELIRRCSERIELTLDHPKQAIPVMDSMGFTNYQVTDKEHIYIFERLNESAALNMELAKSGIPVKGISITSEELETYFLNLTGGADHA